MPETYLAYSTTAAFVFTDKTLLQICACIFFTLSLENLAEWACVSLMLLRKLLLLNEMEAYGEQHCNEYPLDIYLTIKP